jgi:hypothetical protein
MLSREGLGVRVVEPTGSAMKEKQTNARGRNLFPTQNQIAAAFAAGVEIIEITRPDGMKVTFRKNGAAPKTDDEPENIRGLIK